MCLSSVLFRDVHSSPLPPYHPPPPPISHDEMSPRRQSGVCLFKRLSAGLEQSGACARPPYRSGEEKWPRQFSFHLSSIRHFLIFHIHLTPGLFQNTRFLSFLLVTLSFSATALLHIHLLIRVHTWSFFPSLSPLSSFHYHHHSPFPHQPFSYVSMLTIYFLSVPLSPSCPSTPTRDYQHFFFSVGPISLFFLLIQIAWFPSYFTLFNFFLCIHLYASSFSSPYTNFALLSSPVPTHLPSRIPLILLQLNTMIFIYLFILFLCIYLFIYRPYLL